MTRLKHLTLTSFILLTSLASFAQNLEVTGYFGGQLNGGADLSTTQFRRIEVENSATYGASVGYNFGEHVGAEFQWMHSRADTMAEPILSAPSIKLFSLNQNQYMGNFLFHFTERESKLRPFFLVGLGANNLVPSREGVRGVTKFAFAVGGGAKYNLAKHFGLRGQVRYAPTYLKTTSDGGYWCDPFWGGCWLTGDDHYLNVFEYTGGITFRF